METAIYRSDVSPGIREVGMHNSASTDDNDKPVFTGRSEVVTMQPQTLENNHRPIFAGRSEIITMQPQTLESDDPGARRPIPVSTVDWRSTNRSQFIPMRGLDFLIGVSSLIIQQTVELGDLSTNIESENRYTVKVPGGEMLYMGYEVSESYQRACFGSSRSFSFSLIDNTRQEALLLKRRFAGASCCFPCRLQEMEVMLPMGEFIGRVSQQWTMTIPFYLLTTTANDVLYILEGPNIAPCTIPQEAEFKILSADAMTEQGTIVHKWDARLVNYTMTVNFPLMAADPKQKALVLAAAFLLEYTYFERAKTRSMLRCNCC